MPTQASWASGFVRYIDHRCEQACSDNAHSCQAARSLYAGTSGTLIILQHPGL